MKIGFDAKRAAQNRTGLGNYSRFVLDILAKYAPKENQYFLFTPNPKKATLLRELLQNPLFLLSTPKGLWKKLKLLWRTWGITNDLQADGVQLFHGLSNELPLNIRKVENVKSVVTIHDLIFLHFPKYYKPIDRTIYNYKFRKACENADRIIAVSECTKRDIISFYHIDQKKIDVVYQGCDSAFNTAASEEKKQEVRQKYGISAPYILYVGSIEERKNLLLLAKALKLVPDDIRAIAVGKQTPYARKVDNYINGNGLRNRMQLISNVPFGDLPALYQMATIFVYPSRFEGFGIPILEALASGTPVIGCTGSCLEEAGGSGSIYISPDDEQALANAIARIWNDKNLQQQMIEKGKIHALRFAPEILVKDLLESYRKTMQDMGEQPTGAFPSSHVGVCLICMYLILKYSKKIFFYFTSRCNSSCLRNGLY